MRKLMLILTVMNFAVLCGAQKPVKWQFSAKKVNSVTYEVHATATIDEPWSIYSQTTPEGGPLPTNIVFRKNPLITAVGNIKEVGDMKKKYEDVFEIDVLYYKKKVDFVQLVKVKQPSGRNVKTNLAGSVEFMVCNDSQCLPPETINFTVSLN